MAAKHVECLDCGEWSEPDWDGDGWYFECQNGWCPEEPHAPCFVCGAKTQWAEFPASEGWRCDDCAGQQAEWIWEALPTKVLEGRAEE